MMRLLLTSSSSNVTIRNRIQKRNYVKSFKEKKEWFREQRNIAEEIHKEATESNFKTDWDIKAAVLVERPRVLVPEDPKWLKKYKEWKARWDKPFIENRGTLEQLSEGYWIQKDLDEKKKKDLEKEKKNLANLSEPERIAKERQMEMEEKERRKLEIRNKLYTDQEVVMGPRITKADKEGDMRSLRRKLDKKLFLIVKKDRENYQWQLPQSSYIEEDGIDLRKTAIRALAKECGSDPKFRTYFEGFAPLNYYCYKYPAQLQQERNTFGAKVFFYSAIFLEGSPQLDTSHLSDFMWVTKEELPEYLHSDLYDRVKDFLPFEFPFQQVPTNRAD